MKKIYKFFVCTFVFIFLSIVGINTYIYMYAKNFILPNDVILTPQYVGVVLGAAVWGNTPSDVLKDRLKVASNMYKNKSIKKIIVSGDYDVISSYDEPGVMKKYLILLGVSENDIVIDSDGFDTFNSLLNTKDIFQKEKIIIFTQDFHLKRALYIGKKFGLDVRGVETNLNTYEKSFYNNFREIFARVKAFIEINVRK